MIIEVEKNPNCDGCDMKVFQELGPSKPVQSIHYCPPSGEARWCDVTGWSLEQGGLPCPAQVCRVGDSGAGHAFLIHGGDGGLRFKPQGSPLPWDLREKAQWGEPYLVYGDEEDIHYAD